ncbi:MAG: hypothetical protein ACOCW4_01385 [bacterium]
MPYLLFVLHLTAWLYLLRRLYLSSFKYIQLKFFLTLLAYKVMMGCLLGGLYFYYYEGGDTVAYYADIVRAFKLFYEDPAAFFNFFFGLEEAEKFIFAEQERALFFVKLCSLISIFSLGNYWIISVSLSLLSFTAAWQLSLLLKRLMDWPFLLPLLALLIYPSVAFWSAGLLKESLSLTCIYGLVFISLRWYAAKPTKSLLFVWEVSAFLLLAFLLWQLKYYFAAVLLPLLLLILMLNGLFKLRKRGYKGFAWLLLVLIPVLPAAAFLLHPNLEPSYLLQAIVLNHDLTLAASEAGDAILFENLQPTVSSFLLHLPEALFSGLFRPLPWEAQNWLQLLAALENSLLLLISSFAFYHFLKSRNRPKDIILLLSCLIYVCSLAALIALASPNFGSLIRYKVAYAPFFALICLSAISSLIFRDNKSQSIKTA